MTDKDVEFFAQSLAEEHGLEIKLNILHHTIECQIKKDNVTSSFRDNKSQFKNSLISTIKTFQQQLKRRQ